jgi:glycogen debranching enzyme
VLNHTASNSEWLLEHPDAGYNIDVCPHLYSAWLFDNELCEFSNLFAEKKI